MFQMVFSILNRFYTNHGSESDRVEKSVSVKPREQNRSSNENIYEQNKIIL